jgi:phosphatidylglycerophosphatase A
VFDEVVGYWAAMLFLPKKLWIAILGFFVFRVMDIVKPFPAGRSQRLPGGWGVMMDDLMAGVYSCVVLHGVLWWKDQG